MPVDLLHRSLLLLGVDVSRMTLRQALSNARLELSVEQENIPDTNVHGQHAINLLEEHLRLSQKAFI